MTHTQIGFSALVSMLRAHRKADSKDMQYVMNCPRSHHYFSESTLATGNALGIDFELGFSDFVGQKQIKRLTEYVNACHTGLLSDFDVTHARLLVAMRLAQGFDLCTDALHTLAANARSESANVRGITLASMSEGIKTAQGMGTVTSKTSNSTGARGFMQIQGMTFAPPERNHAVMLNTDHPAVKRFFEIYDTSTAGQLAAFNAKGTTPE